MNSLLLKKIKIALKSTKPLESIQDVVDEFDEVERLVKWRERVLISGDIKKHKKELDKIVEIMDKYSYPYDIHKDSLDAMVREYIKEFKSIEK